jgi:hypothetical protein
MAYFQIARYPTSPRSMAGRISNSWNNHFCNWAAVFCTSEATNKFETKEPRCMGDIQLLEIVNEGTNNSSTLMFCDLVAGIHSLANSLSNYYTTNL